MTSLTYHNERLPSCYATCSIGYNHPSHTLPNKLTAIASAGFDSIELSMPDILSFASSHFKHDVDPKDYESLCTAGIEIRKLCEQSRLKVAMLQPFANFEGWPQGSRQRDEAFERARGWIQIMESVGTDMLQVGSSDSEGISRDFDVFAADLRELGEMLGQKGFKVAYENWCWAAHAPGWKEVWEIVKKVGRSNVGLCLDTFQSAGGEWGSPCTGSGLVEHELGREELKKSWRESLQELVQIVPGDKIFILQISDAYRMDPPLGFHVDKDGLRPRGQWSHDHRPLPYDGGYLPVEDFTKAVLETGFRGYMSVEVFDGKAPEKYGEDMTPYAKKAMCSLQKLMKACDGRT